MINHYRKRTATMKRFIIALALTLGALTVGVTPAVATGDHEWRYDVTCQAVSGSRPNTDSVDSNIRIKNLDTDEVRTFNYHGPDSGPSGAFSYSLANDYKVPADWTHVEVQWVQVNGTNYHWEGALECGEPTEEPLPEGGDESRPHTSAPDCVLHEVKTGIERRRFDYERVNGEVVKVYRNADVNDGWFIQPDSITTRTTTEAECPPVVVDKFPYEVTVCWTMDHSDGIEGTYEWPQTRGDCVPVPKCEEVIEIQQDTYWIRDKADEDYLAGLTVLNSSADDASLEAHDYFSKVFRGAEECPVVEPPVVVPPVVTPPVVVPPVVVPPVVVPPVVTPPVTEPPGEIDTPISEHRDNTPPVETTPILPNTGGFDEAYWLAGGLLSALGVAFVGFALFARRRIN